MQEISWPQHINGVQVGEADVGADYEGFEMECLNSDAMALVEYALDMKTRGCTFNLDVSNGRHRHLQTWLSYLGTTDEACPWDVVNDIANDVNTICCGIDDVNCPASSFTPSA
eukprot:SAG31_NODE_25005_length_470_cov_0.628032_1_plen_112_part_01